MEIKDIFPTPIGFSYNERLGVDEMHGLEHEWILNQPFEYHSEYEMHVSKNKFMITTSPLTQLHEFLETELNEYSKKTLGTDQRLSITQSWCTKHENSIEKTFAHVHQNSIISGVYYLQADENSEGITFHKNTDYNDRYITWKTNDDLMKKYYWNWRWCKFPVKTGLLILFPSHLKHEVNGITQNNSLRCSLAFNSWFTDPIGSEDDLSLLKF